MLTRTTLLATLALPILTGTASAADIPGNKSTKAVLKPGTTRSEGIFEQRGDADWYKVKLKAKEDYAFDVAVRGRLSCVTLSLRDASGKELKSALANGGEDGGFEFHAAKAATVFAELKDCSRPDGDPGYPATYTYRLVTDARGDKVTQATIKVGQTIKGLASWVGDDDYFRTRLERGKTYTLAVKGGEEGFLRLIDAKGKVIFKVLDGDPKVTGFTVPATGTYYVLTSPTHDSGFSYTLSLTTP